MRAKVGLTKNTARMPVVCASIASARERVDDPMTDRRFRATVSCGGLRQTAAPSLGLELAKLDLSDCGTSCRAKGGILLQPKPSDGAAQSALLEDAAHEIDNPSASDATLAPSLH